MIDLCKVCGHNRFNNIFSFSKTIYSDGNISESPFEKEECCHCGTIRTKSKNNLEAFYKLDYAPSRNIDTIAISKDGELTRSEFIYKWIQELTKDLQFYTEMRLIEIGCGHGCLLEKFDFKNKFGVEPSLDASKNAMALAEVRNIGFEKIADSEKYDLTLSYCVIEHLQEPCSFLEKNYNILEDNGIMVVALPIQDKFNYDLLFVDHLHHFSHENFTKLLNKNGFKILNYQLGKESYFNIAMYICQKTNKTNDINFTFTKNHNIKNIEKVFENIDSIIENYKDKKLYGFGYGEVSKTTLPYTELDKYILNYIDDYVISNRVINSEKSKELFEKQEDIYIILLVNPMHSEKIKLLYADYPNVNFLNIFNHIEMDNI